MVSEIQDCLIGQDFQFSSPIDRIPSELRNLSAKTQNIAGRYLELCAKYHQFKGEVSEDFICEFMKFSEEADRKIESNEECRNAFRNVLDEKLVGNCILNRSAKVNNSNHGLPNLGNTCFANATIQFLFDIPGIDEILASNPTPTNTNPEKKAFKESLRNLRAEYRKESPDPATIRNLLDRLWSSPLLKEKGFQMKVAQEDADEFLVALYEILDVQHANCSLNIASMRIDPNTHETVKGGTINERVVHLPCANTLQECINEFLKEEKLEEEEIPKEFSNCNIKRLFFQGEPPQTIQFGLKRFNEFGQKIESDIKGTSIAIPFTHDGNITNATYEVDSVICHVGASPDSGHYFTLVKTTNGWTQFDDSVERSLSPEEGREIIQRNGYLIKAHRI